MCVIFLNFILQTTILCAYTTLTSDSFLFKGALTILDPLNFYVLESTDCHQKMGFLLGMEFLFGIEFKRSVWGTLTSLSILHLQIYIYGFSFHLFIYILFLIVMSYVL